MWHHFVNIHSEMLENDFNYNRIKIDKKDT